jgi:hypothetical protein
MILGTRKRRTEKLHEEVAELSRENREQRDPELEQRILELRHRAGIEMLDQANGRPPLAEPASELPPSPAGVPELVPAELSAAGLRAAILESGCLLIRGLVSPARAEEMAADMDRAIEARASGASNGAAAGLYQEFDSDPRFQSPDRPWVTETGGLLVADSPKLMFDTLDLFEQAGLRDLLTGYLGERPAVSVQKSTLRKADPNTPGAWHQDGAFMGDVRAMNVWLSLSHCGDDAPGLDLLPRRLDDYLPTGTEGAWLETQVSDSVAREAAGEAGVLRPIFEPGDALLFDELFLHQTASDPSMPNERYAIEMWFFGPSGFPESYAPVAF